MTSLLPILVAGIFLQGPEERIQAATARFELAHKEFEMTLLEIGPAAIPELQQLAGRLEGLRRDAVRRAIDEIKRLQGQIEKLIVDLGSDQIDAREKATAELRKIGRPARPYLEQARESKDAEVRARAQTVLLIISRRTRDRLRWSTISQFQAKRVETVEKQREAGVATAEDLLRARRDLARSRCKAGEITLREYLQETRKILAQGIHRAELNFEMGRISQLELLKAKLEALYVDRRLGTVGEDQLHEAQMKAEKHARHLKETGRMSDQDYLKELVEIITDRDEDLDD